MQVFFEGAGGAVALGFGRGFVDGAELRHRGRVESGLEVGQGEGFAGRKGRGRGGLAWHHGEGFRHYARRRHRVGVHAAHGQAGPEGEVGRVVEDAAGEREEAALETGQVLH